jgi:hypothetical protein
MAKRRSEAATLASTIAVPAKKAPGDRLVEDDGDDREVGDRGGAGGAFVLDQAVIQAVGNAGADGAEGDDAGDDVDLGVDGWMARTGAVMTRINVSTLICAAARRSDWCRGR